MMVDDELVLIVLAAKSEAGVTSETPTNTASPSKPAIGPELELDEPELPVPAA